MTLLIIRCKKHGDVLVTVENVPSFAVGRPIMAMRCKQCTHAMDVWDHREKYGDLVGVPWSEVAGLIARAQKTGKPATYNLTDPGNPPDGPRSHQLGE